MASKDTAQRRLAALERAAEAAEPMTKEQMFKQLYGPESDYLYEDE
jgi:hypothetical protein